MKDTSEKNVKNSTVYLILAIAVVLIILAVTFLLLRSPKNPTKTDGTTETATTETTTTDGVPSSGDVTERKKGYHTFLIAGVDVVSRSTDVLMLVSLDNEKNEMNVVQIPRDTFVNKFVGGYTSVTRVNSIYSAAYNKNMALGEYGEKLRKKSMTDLQSRLEESLGVTIDDYILVNTKAFRGIVDAIGGVWFDVPQDMDYDDPEQGLSIHLKSGYQLLSGEDAEGLIRYRKGYARGDIDRVSLRADFLREMLRQTKENLTLTALVKIIGETISSVDTSISLTDAISLVTKVRGVSSDDVKFVTLSGSSVQNPADGTWAYYVLNRKKAREDLSLYINVYPVDIPDEKFDPNGFFTDRDDPAHEYINNYYNS